MNNRPGQAIDSDIDILGLVYDGKIIWTFGSYSSSDSRDHVVANLDWQYSGGRAGVLIIANEVNLAFEGESLITLGSISNSDRSKIDNLRDNEYGPISSILISIDLNPSVLEVAFRESTGLEWPVFRWSTDHRDAERFRWRYESLEVSFDEFKLVMKQRMPQLLFRSYKEFHDVRTGFDPAPLARPVSAKIVRPFWATCRRLVSKIR
ncbi:MAG: hypothetical protein IPJ71_10365 [Bdellovibrionales bacterium]|nr:hypothetical protein [Bdellovibrionales bacterium]